MEPLAVLPMLSNTEITSIDFLENVDTGEAYMVFAGSSPRLYFAKERDFSTSSFPTSDKQMGID